MPLDESVLPVTRAQLDIWLAHHTNHADADWHIGLFVKIDGALDRDALEWAVRRVVREAEPIRATFFEVDGQVRQKPLDYPDVELTFVDLTGSRDPVQEARDMACAIQRRPMPLSGPLFRFALFQTRADGFCLLGCCHHIVLDGSGIALVGQRLASVYSAVIEGAPIPPVLFGSLSDLVECESEYEASQEYRDDQAYWTRHLPWEAESDERSEVAGDRQWPSAPVRLDPDLLRRVEAMAEARRLPRASIITAACGLLVHGWTATGPDVVLDLPVNRRSSPESKTLPGMVAGVVPLVLTMSSDTSIAGFCAHVDSRLREAVQHQRFPVHALEEKDALRGTTHQ